MKRGRSGTVLLVDDDPHVRMLMARWLEGADFTVKAYDSGEACLAELDQVLPDAVVLDLHMPGMGGMATLAQIVSRHRGVPVMMLTAETDVPTVVEAMQKGCWDYLNKPVDKTRLRTAVRNAVDHSQLSRRVRSLEREASGRAFGGLIGESPAMKRVFRELDRLSGADITTLIRGESGTGKELIAQALHEDSPRAPKNFVAVNCAAIPKILQESELFGHEAGSFTGATQKRIGRFEQANGGTLFLDEVAELDLDLQAKLLRAIQERTFYRVGGSKEIHSDFRLICASHKDLHARAQTGAFREDLFYRVAVYEFEVPPLRAREDDVLRLARFFLRKQREKAGQPEVSLSPSASEALMGYGWPGNVRELQNAMQRAALLAEEQVELKDLPPRLLRAAQAPLPSPPAAAPTAHATPTTPVEAPAPPAELPASPAASLAASAGPDGVKAHQIRTLAELERAAIESSIERNGGNLSEVVRELGIGRTTLYRKLKQYREGG